MKASDYIVEFLIAHKITDVFGYPGGMVTHLMDSFGKYSEKITTHLNYHEQACAMAACAWAEITGLPGVAYATSGPGATNLLTGIACAYFDSIPCIFITGQVNTYEQKDELGVRQKGFQETDIVSITQTLTKKSIMVRSTQELPGVLEDAYRVSMEGRKGPVLIDIPMNVFRGELIEQSATNNNSHIKENDDVDRIANEIIETLKNAKRPVILAGHGIALSQTTDLFRHFVKATGIPTVTSMLGVDTIPSNDPCCFNMIGAYGVRWANHIINHSDCVLCLGSRLDCRQTGVNKSQFAPFASIIRVDIDSGEMENVTKTGEKQYCVLLEQLIPALDKKCTHTKWLFEQWRQCCENIKTVLASVDRDEPGNLFAQTLGEVLPERVTVTTDVGQNQVWIAQSMAIGDSQRLLSSGGHGAMGYSLPAAIGASIATRKPVVCVTGDGGFQMNIQELETVVREKLPVKIILLNNHALGMIHHFQEMYFDSCFIQTEAATGFTVPDFQSIAKAYGIKTLFAPNREDLEEALTTEYPVFIEIPLPQNTHVFPKLGLNKPIHEQEPPLPPEVQKRVEAEYMAYDNYLGA